MPTEAYDTGRCELRKMAGFMGKLNIAPTKSNLLVLKKQLTFAEEGYDLLEQKRQILIFELMSRLARARDAEQGVAKALGLAFAALQEAQLEIGSDNIDRATLAVNMASGGCLWPGSYGHEDPMTVQQSQ